MKKNMRTDIPNPQFYRPSWKNLHGMWDFHVDDASMIRGNDPDSFDEQFVPVFDAQIHVPFCPQSDLSKVEYEGHHPVLWYRRMVEFSEEERQGRVLLHFGAVDFSCMLRVNRKVAGSHTGGYAPFHFDISPFLHAGENEILLQVIDHRDPAQPRGKQSWQSPFSCWYQECSGIWQPVWIECAPRQGIAAMQMRTTVIPDSHDAKSPSGILHISLHPFETSAAEARVQISYQGRIQKSLSAALQYPCTEISVEIADLAVWSPDDPRLYEIVVETQSSFGTDRVESYVGFRHISIRNGMLQINGKPVYQRLVLDQGYWEDGQYTAPSDEAIRRDIELAKEMGFNGCRKHVKVEDPRFYYWADVLGYLVWEELPSAYVFSETSQRHLFQAATDMVQRDIAHPSVIAWTLCNESWGVKDIACSRKQQEFLLSLLSHVRRLDPTRLVVANEGWEHVEGDVYGLHSYAATAEVLEDDVQQAFLTPAVPKALSGGRMFRVADTLPDDRLHMITEFGGIGLRNGTHPQAWAYDTMATSEEELASRMRELLRAVKKFSFLSGFVYTQFTDVAQEVNGLLTSARLPKIPLEVIRKIILHTEKIQ